GRCKVCNAHGQGQWARLANLREHEKGQPHQQNLARKLRIANEVPRVSHNTLLNTLPTRPPEVVTSDNYDEFFPQLDWLPLSLGEDIIEGQTRPGDVNERERKVRLAMENHALAGRVAFSAGEESLLGGGDSEVSLEDVLAGSGLFRAALHPEDEDDDILDSSQPESQWNGSDWHDIGGGYNDANDLSQHFFGARQGPQEGYFPYPNKAMMKTDILFSSPDLRVSRSQKEAILGWGRALGAQDVPSLYKVEKFQAEALEAYGNPTERGADVFGPCILS
ncbi:hypothetical protein BD309DRAFT_85074, partial [Dichomitus squalens]